MKTIFVGLILGSLLLLGAQSGIMVPILSPASGPPPSAPTAPNAACFTPDAVSPYTTTAVNTTGAEAIAVTITLLSGTTYTVVDNADSATLTPLAQRGDGGGGAGAAAQIQYELNPATTSSSATFTFTSSATSYGQVCIIPILGVTGVYDSNDTGAVGTSSACQAGSITPSSAPSMVVASVDANVNAGTITIDSSYTIAGQAAHSGTGFSGAGAYLGQATGAATNPAWGGFNSTPYTTACVIASFH